MKFQWLFHGLALFISLVYSSSYAVADLSTSRQRLSIVDVSLRLLWVLEPMNDSVKESFVTACRVFLEGHLNVAPTTIINLQAAVGSQELDNLHSVADDYIFPLSANIEVMVEYYIDSGDANLGEMERRIKTLFLVEWEEFLALLLLLDPDFFSPIQRIFLEASIDPVAPTPSPPLTPQRTETSTTSSTIVIVFIVVGVGVVVSLAMTIPVIFKQSKSRNPECNPTITTSCTNDEGAQSRDGGKSVLSSEMEYTDSRRDAQSIYSDDNILSYSLRNLRSQKANSQVKFQQTISDFKSAVRVSSSEGPPQNKKPPTAKAAKPAKASKRADVEISRVSTQSSTDNQSLDDHVVPVIPIPAVSKPGPVASKPGPVAPKPGPIASTKGHSQDKCQQTRSGFKLAFRIPSGERPPQKEIPPTEKPPQKERAATRVSTPSSTENQYLDDYVVPVIPIPALSKPAPVAPKPAPAVSRKPQVQPPSRPIPVVLLRQQDLPPPTPPPHWISSSDASHFSLSTMSCGGAFEFDEEEAQPGTLVGDDRTIETIQTKRRAEYTSADDFGSIAGSLPKPKKVVRKRTEAAWSRDIKNLIVLKPRNKPTQKSPEPDAPRAVLGCVISTAARLETKLSTLYSVDADEDDDDFGSIAGSLPKPEKCNRSRIDS